MRVWPRPRPRVSQAGARTSAPWCALRGGARAAASPWARSGSSCPVGGDVANCLGLLALCPAGVCNCYPGFTGGSCQVDCQCNGHGTCTTNNTCACDEGYKWSASGCVLDCSCSNGAACIAPGKCGCEPSCQNGTCYSAQCECWAGGCRSARGLGCPPTSPASPACRQACMRGVILASRWRRRLMHPNPPCSVLLA